jgi:hypothetical protein
MPDGKPDFLNHASQRKMALSRWENEGGAGHCGPVESMISGKKSYDVPPLTDVELVQLRVRVIVLENLVITLLAEGSDRQLEIAREMAAYISSRSGFTQHRLTIHAAAHMIDIIERSSHFRGIGKAI